MSPPQENQDNFPESRINKEKTPINEGSDGRKKSERFIGRDEFANRAKLLGYNLDADFLGRVFEQFSISDIGEDVSRIEIDSIIMILIKREMNGIFDAADKITEHSASGQDQPPQKTQEIKVEEPVVVDSSEDKGADTMDTHKAGHTAEPPKSEPPVESFVIPTQTSVEPPEPPQEPVQPVQIEEKVKNPTPPVEKAKSTPEQKAGAASIEKRIQEMKLRKK